MICLIALIVAGILGIFSVRYRKLATEAFDCVFRRITLRPCTSGLDRRLKNKIVGAVSRKHIGLAKFIVKYFEILSWFFTILLITSLFFSARGIYFYVVYGNCNGDQGGFCVFDALNPQDQSTTCEDPNLIPDNQINIKPTADDDPSLGPEDAKVTIIEFGCFSCPYTREAEPTVQKILEKYEGKIKFVHRDFPLPNHDNSRLMAKAAYCADQQGKFWAYHDLLFTYAGEIKKENLLNLIPLDGEDFYNCLESEEAEQEITKDFEDGKLAGVYGTPTFFINDVVVVGPKPLRYVSNIIDKELKKN